MDAIQRLGSGGVDGHDARVRVGTPQDLPVQHARELDVVGVDRPPRGLVQTLDLPARVADQP
jgi:hypothetical protein